VESIDDNFLTQVIKAWTSISPLLNMISTNKRDFVRDGKVRESLVCTDQEMMEFSTQSDGNKVIRRITAQLQ